MTVKSRSFEPKSTTSTCEAEQQKRMVRPLAVRLRVLPTDLGACEEGRELPDRLSVLVLFPNSVGVPTTTPLGESNEMSQSILIDEDLMRDIAIKVPHIRPHLACEAESLFFRAGLQPSVPNDSNHQLPPDCCVSPSTQRSDAV